ncbi:MAG: 16S rRNA (cytosine(1402)-N(4))-methyltransferase RsmH [Breznakibacter sp.]|nr:16S rRNA (cytosine(1402)-N(4))-methyltransferase RsmH [Breznakibacter sp.]
MSEEVYHVPVLLRESVDGLNIQPNGIYVDVTFGGGGHSREILNRLQGGKLIVFDQDEDAYANRPNDDRLIFVRHNFRYLKNFLTYLGIDKVDGVLGDLGVSSHHFDTAERGFSFRFEGKLDMRMNYSAGITAADVLNTYSDIDLMRIFRLYGEVDSPGKMVREIVTVRETKPFETIEELKAAAVKFVPSRDQTKQLAKVFQALRIEVNHEMAALTDMLHQCSDVVKEGGRISIISYHSLEDRLVKNFIKTGNCEEVEVEKDFYGNILAPFKAVNRKLIIPTDAEIEINSRARSAKLRIAERV